MLKNIYQFKVSYYGERHVTSWYPPIEAKTYQQALAKLYRDADVESATLQIIILPDETEITSRHLHNPSQYDL